ncbi:hypothetical protein T4B_2854, partial [Trichinella pseudospiralis]
LTNNAAHVYLTFVASGSIVKFSLRIMNGAKKKHEANHGHHKADQERKKDMEVKKIIVKTRTTGSGPRTARSRSKQDMRYAVPRGSQFCKPGLGILQKGEVIP